MDSHTKQLKITKPSLDLFRPSTWSGRSARIRDVVQEAGGNLIPVPPASIQPDWDNLDNQKTYYDKVVGKSLERRAASIGLDKCPELEILKAEIFSTIPEHLLEIGAGYGRSLRWLAKNLPGSKITAVEINPRLAKQLSREFKRHDNVRIIQQDIFDVSVEEPVQFAFLLWSVFAEFNPAEKLILLKKIRAMLTRNGKLTLDLPRLVAGEAAASAAGGDFFTHRDETGELTVHLSNDQEIFELAKKAGFSQTRRSEYATATNLPRICFTLHN